MKLLHLKAENLFSLGLVELDLNNRGLLLVKGWSKDEDNENGAGKSSLCNKALCWGLYGKFFGGIKGDNVINRFSKKDETCYIEIKFTGIDKSNYKIRRSRNPAQLSLFNEHDIDISSKLERETQQVINSLLGRDFKTFTQIDFFGQNRHQAFLELPPTEQEELVNNILPIDRLKLFEERSKIAISSLSDLSKLAQQNLIKAETQSELCKTQITHSKRKVKEWEVYKKSSIVSHKKDIDNFLETKRKLNNSRNYLTNKLEGIDKEFLSDSIKNIDIQLQKNEKEKESLLSEINNLNSRKLLKQESLKQNKEKISSLVTSINSVCRTCGQTVPKARIKTLLEEITALEEKVLLESKELKNFFNEDVYNRELKKNAEELRKLKSQRSNFQQSILDYFDISAKLENLDTKSIDSNISLLEKTIKEFDSAENPHISYFNLAEEEKKKADSEIKLFSKQLSLLKKEEESLKFWEKAFKKDIKTLLLERACPFLQERSNYYLKCLGNSQIKVKFSINKNLSTGGSKKQFNVSISSSTGGDIFSLLSGGEQQIVKFAVGLALSDLAESQISGTSNCLILDEPFENLSPKNTEYVVNFLSDILSTKKSTILLISNNSYLKSIVPNFITVIKEKGISRIERH